MDCRGGSINNATDGSFGVDHSDVHGLLCRTELSGRNERWVWDIRGYYLLKEGGRYDTWGVVQQLD